MIEIIGEIGRPATKEEIKHFLHEDADCGKKNEYGLRFKQEADDAAD